MRAMDLPEPSVAVVVTIVIGMILGLIGVGYLLCLGAHG